MGGDEERARPAPEVLLDPFEGVEVEVVRRLVEQQQVRIGDDEAGQGRAGLLAARHRDRRPCPLVPGEPETGERLVDALVERVAAHDLELVLEVLVGGLGDPVVLLQATRARAPSARGARRPPRTAIRRSGAAMNAGSRWVSWSEEAEAQAALARDLAAVRVVDAGRDPEQRRLAGAVRTDQADALAQGDRGADVIEDDERADLAADRPEAQDRHQPGPGGRGPPPGASPQRDESARCVPAPWPRRRSGSPRPASARPSPPPRARSSRRPARRRSPVVPRRMAAPAFRSAGESRWHHEQKWVARAPMTIRRTGRPQRGHGSPVRW